MLESNLSGPKKKIIQSRDYKYILIYQLLGVHGQLLDNSTPHNLLAVPLCTTLFVLQFNKAVRVLGSGCWILCLCIVSIVTTVVPNP